ncbi:FadR/GntR family transcriptional regulator [Lacipirellula parvula]|uniref:Transcriptional regulator n=1 Tax=Lacipirellula parvula TaxID=2650471 RepID=A0A5K7XBE5_9BACT|nr:FCD domain-containing protein [Lacipirellula parvula]BBO33347.1 transcriptional regulator [Lacipirellula parvula]
MRQDSPSTLAPSASQPIEAFLNERILTGEWSTGFKLPSEESLRKQFGASRTVVREAIRRLQGRGLVKTVNGSGSFVAGGELQHVSNALNAYSVLAVDHHTFTDLLELRMAIEGDAAAKGAEDREGKAWRQLEAKLQSMSAARIIEEFAILDIDFHMELLRTSGNELFASLGAALRDRYVRFAIDSYRSSEHLRTETMTEHRVIVDAIKSGRSEVARDAARSHVSRSRGRWEELHHVIATPVEQATTRADASVTGKNDANDRRTHEPHGRRALRSNQRKGAS